MKRTMSSILVSMKCLISSFGILIIFGANVYGQNASIQVIHNSPDPALRTVDIWIGNIRAMDNVVYRSATAFRSFPVGTNTVFEVRVCAANSTDTIRPFFFGRATLLANGRYIIIASGMLNGSSPSQQFTITNRANANVTSNVPRAVFLAPFNGLAGSASSSWLFPFNNKRIVSRLDENSFGNNVAISTPFRRLAFQIPNRNQVFTADIDFSSLIDSAAVGMLSGILDNQTSGSETEEEFILVTPRGRVLRYPLRVFEGRFFQVINQCLDTTANQFSIRLGANTLRDTLAVGGATSMEEGSGVLYLLPAGGGAVLDSIVLPAISGKHIILISGGRSSLAVGNDGATIPLGFKWLTSFPLVNANPSQLSYTTSMEVREQTPTWTDIFEGLPTARSDVFFRNGRRLTGRRQVMQTSTPSGLYLIWKKSLGVEQGVGALIPVNLLQDSTVTVCFHERILANGSSTVRARVFYSSGRSEDRTLNPGTGYWRWINNVSGGNRDSIVLTAMNHLGNTTGFFDVERGPDRLSPYRLNSLGDSVTFRLEAQVAASRLPLSLSRFGTSPIERMVIVSGDTARRRYAINSFPMSHRYAGFQLDDSVNMSIVNGMTDTGLVRVVVGAARDTVARLRFGEQRIDTKVKADETYLDLISADTRITRRYRLPLWEVPEFERNVVLVLKGHLVDSNGLCRAYIVTGLGRKLELQPLPLSVKPERNSGNLELYPMPVSSGQVLFVKEAQQSMSTYQIIDITGRVITSNPISIDKGNLGAIPLPMMPSGSYVLLISGSAGKYAKRFVVR